MRQKIAEYAKFIAALLGLAATSFAFAVPPEVAPWIAATTAFLTAFAVLLVPNKAPVDDQGPVSVTTETIPAGEAPSYKIDESGAVHFRIPRGIPGVDQDAAVADFIRGKGDDQSV